MAVANRTITFPALTAGAQTIPWVATVTLTPVNCRGVTTDGHTLVGSLVTWSLATHPNWVVISRSWKQRIRKYRDGEIISDHTYTRTIGPTNPFPDPNPANWGLNWINNERRWFNGSDAWMEMSFNFTDVLTISDIEFEFHYYPFPLLPLHDPDTKLIIRSANGIIMRGP